MCLDHLIHLFVRRFPHPTFAELLHVSAAVAYLSPTNGVSDDTVRAVTLQSTGADFKLFAHFLPRHPRLSLPPALLIRYLLLLRFLCQGHLHVCRYLLDLLHEGGKRFAFDCYYFHNLLIIWFSVAKVRLFVHFSFHVRSKLLKIFFGCKKTSQSFIRGLYGGCIPFFHQMMRRKG